MARSSHRNRRVTRLGALALLLVAACSGRSLVPLDDSPDPAELDDADASSAEASVPTTDAPSPFLEGGSDATPDAATPDATPDACSPTWGTPPTGAGVAEAKVSGGTVYNALHSGNFTSISGGTAVVGHQGNFGTSGGSVAVSRWDTCNNAWTLEQTITQPNPGPTGGDEDVFGSTVSVNGDTLAVGANYKDLGGGARGQVYVFGRSGTTWTSAQTITGNGALGGRFGWAIVQDGTTMVVSGPQGKDPTLAVTFTGTASIYTKGMNGQYAYRTFVIGTGLTQFDTFGYSLSLSGDTLVAGAPGARVFPNTTGRPGKAFVFTGSVAAWTQTGALTASDGANNDWFGKSGGRSGNVVIVGAPLHDSAGADAGAAYVFTYANGAWTQTAKLVASDAAAGAWFGFTVAALSETRLLVGAAEAGKVYSFSYANGAWTQDAAHWQCTTGNIGYTLAVSGNLAITGKPGGRILDLAQADTTCTY